MQHRIPNIPPPLLSMPDHCKSHWDSRAGYMTCECRRFGAFFVPDKETAKNIWLERHVGREVLEVKA